MTSVLDREMYTEAGAARLLRIRQSTLHYWLEGSQGHRREYRPILRDEARGHRMVTWAEFVEAGVLRSTVARCRCPWPSCAGSSRHFGTASACRIRWPTGGRSSRADGLVYDAQTSAGLGIDFWLVAVAGEELLLTTSADAFLRRIDWSDNIAIGYNPDANQDSPVRIQPDVRFGRPSIKGISTEAIWEQREAGEETEAMAEMFALTPADVDWALAYAHSTRAIHAA